MIDKMVKNSDVVTEGIHEFIIENHETGCVSRTFYRNLIVDNGLEAICELLIPATSITTEGINFCGLGTGTTEIASSDTELENEGARRPRGAGLRSGLSVVVSFYFSPDDGNGTWTRYGTFFDGTSVPDSGSLFTHLEIDLTKGASEGLTINSQYTLLDVSSTGS